MPEIGIEDFVYYLFKTKAPEKDEIIFLLPSIIKVIIDLPEWKILDYLKECVKQEIKQKQLKEDQEFRSSKETTKNIGFLSTNVQFRERINYEYPNYPITNELFEKSIEKYFAAMPGEIDDYSTAINENVSENLEIQENSILKRIHDSIESLRQEHLKHDQKMGEKIDDVKQDTEIIKEYASQIENIFDQLENLETFLKQALQSDFQKIKVSWENYRQRNITRKDFIKESLEMLGKSFAKRIFDKYSPI